MAIIRKAIGGLNPGSDYLFTVKPKNIEIVASDDEQESIRVSIPTFSGTPSTITGLQLASNFQSVIFKFDIINDRDLSYFEYQLYDNSAGTGDPINAVYSKANGQSSVKISGTNTHGKGKLGEYLSAVAKNSGKIFTPFLGNWSL